MDINQLLQFLRQRQQPQAINPVQQGEWSRIMSPERGDDSQTRTLEQLMSMNPRMQMYMGTHQQNSQDFRESGGRWDPQELDLRQRENLINRLLQLYQMRRQPM